MITDDQVLRLFERADPALVDDDEPADVDGFGYLATVRTRSSTATLIDTEPISTQLDTRRRRIIITLAAAAVVGILVGALVYAGRSGSNEPQIPADTTTAPMTAQVAAEQVAMQFIDATNAYDVDAVRSLVADDAVFTEGSGTDDYTAELENGRIEERRFLEPQCTATVAGPPTSVTCAYLLETFLSSALGVGPFTGSTFEFVIADGRIQRVNHRPDFGEYGPLALDVYTEWLAGAHPDDAAADCDSCVLEQHREEFKAVGPALQFLTARNEWDGGKVRSLVADDADTNGDFAVATVDDYLVNADLERALQWRFREPRCTVVDLGPPAAVTCPYVMENALTRALGVGPYRTLSFEFEIADGRILRVRHEFDFSQYDAEAFGVFADWLDRTHPGDGDVMFDVTDNGTSVRSMTPEALALFEERIPEFVQSVGGS